MEYKKLDPEFKAKWVAALRSGEYKQGRGRLFCFDTYCCLGVAGSVAGISNEAMDDRGYLWDKEEYPESINSVPKSLCGPGVASETVATLTYMNDDGKSFAEIADWIEEHL